MQFAVLGWWFGKTMIRRKLIFVLAAVCIPCAVFIISYFLVLTSYLPSIFIYRPAWIEVGSYANYTVTSWIESGYRLVGSGTYAWRGLSPYIWMLTENS